MKLGSVKDHRVFENRDKIIIIIITIVCLLTTIVRLPESKSSGIRLSTGRQRQVEEQSVCRSREVKLIQQQPADSSIHRVLQQY